MHVAQAPPSHQYVNCPACQWRASCERVLGVKRTHPSSSRGDTAMLRPASTAALKQTPMAFWKFSMSSFVAGGHTCGGAAAMSVMGRFGSGRLLSVRSAGGMSDPGWAANDTSLELPRCPHVKSVAAAAAAASGRLPHSGS